MAKETALAFFRKVREDQKLRAKISRMQRKDVKALLRFAADSGYLFSMKDYQAALEAYGEFTEEVHAKIATGSYVIPGMIALEESP